jgi:hypothetical protein
MNKPEWTDPRPAAKRRAEILDEVQIGLGGLRILAAADLLNAHQLGLLAELEALEPARESAR